MALHKSLLSRGNNVGYQRAVPEKRIALSRRAPRHTRRR